MLAAALPDLAIRGEDGIDVFHLKAQPDQGRSRFRCLGRVRTGPGGAQGIEVFEPGTDPERLRRAARALAGSPGLAVPFSLADATGFPSPLAEGDPAALFQRIDFLRARSLAVLALDRLGAALAADAAAVLARPGQVSGPAALAHDFNLIGRAIALAEALLPALPPPDPGAEGLAWALRMLGDLALRGTRARLALDCFEAALAIGDNPHRRARARAAAQALGDPDAVARHSPPDRTGASR